MSQNASNPALLLAIVLIIVAGVSFVMTDGTLRIVIGVVCIVGLLVAVRQIAVPGDSR